VCGWRDGIYTRHAAIQSLSDSQRLVVLLLFLPNDQQPNKHVDLVVDG